jgi:trans-aconitate methyltransferase
MAIKNAPRVFINIDGEDKLVTNALMMEFAVRALEETDAPAEIVDKAKAHLAQLGKKSTAPKTESRAAKENKALAVRVLQWMPSDHPVLTSEIMEHVNGIMTPQKCTKVMSVLIESGKVRKVEKVKGRYVGYELI